MLANARLKEHFPVRFQVLVDCLSSLPGLNSGIPGLVRSVLETHELFTQIGLSAASCNLEALLSGAPAGQVGSAALWPENYSSPAWKEWWAVRFTFQQEASEGTGIFNIWSQRLERRLEGAAPDQQADFATVEEWTFGVMGEAAVPGMDEAAEAPANDNPQPGEG
ncbi:MAG: hypothetical protein AAF441_04995 [Pseudomonadota bacterium]